MASNSLPPEVRGLYRREREIAEIIYRRGSATANEVQAELSDPLTNAAVRSMLCRLVRKGVLGRRPRECGTEYLYYAAINNDLSRERALKQLADDFFGGSLQEAAATLANLARRTGQDYHGAT